MKALYLILIVVAGIGFLMWSADHDTKVQAAAEKYEACVRVQYGVSPAFWYQEHGSYPECK